MKRKNQDLLKLYDQIVLAKKVAAERAVENIHDGMVVGLGTGSTAEFAIRKIGERVREGLQIRALSTSLRTENLALELGIEIADFSSITQIDISVDGADEVDINNNLIKGGGGSLLREKLIEFNSKTFLVIVDESKCVETLGKFPLPVEIVPFGVPLTMKQLEGLGSKAVMRTNEGKNFITDNGHLIVDCAFTTIPDPASLNKRLKAIPGVVETGLFLRDMVTTVFIGTENGTVHVRDVSGLRK